MGAEAYKRLADLRIGERSLLCGQLRDDCFHEVPVQLHSLGLAVQAVCKQRERKPRRTALCATPVHRCRTPLPEVGAGFEQGTASRTVPGPEPDHLGALRHASAVIAPAFLPVRGDAPALHTLCIGPVPASLERGFHFRVICTGTGHSGRPASVNSARHAFWQRSSG